MVCVGRGQCKSNCRNRVTEIQQKMSERETRGFVCPGVHVTIASPPMRKLLLLLLACVLSSHAFAAPKPIRVLFLGHDSEHHNSAAYLPLLMQKMGREAIYFDYFTTPG